MPVELPIMINLAFGHIMDILGYTAVDLIFGCDPNKKRHTLQNGKFKIRT